MESALGEIGNVLLNVFARLTSTTPSQFYANRSRYTIYLFIILALILVIAGAIGFYRYKQISKKDNSQNRF